MTSSEMVLQRPTRLRTLAIDLDAVTELVERGPCVRAAARNASGNPVPVASPDAWTFCPMGAAIFITRGQPDGDARFVEIIDALGQEINSPTVCVQSWADTHSHAELVALCRRATLHARGGC